MAKDLNRKELPKGISLRKDGRYMAQRIHEGKRYILYNRDLKELKNKFRDLQYELDHGLYAKQENITVVSWFNVWVEIYKEPSVKKGTIALYKDIFNRYLQNTIGSRKLKDIRGEHIQKIYNDLKKEGYSKSTIELVSILLSGMYKQAIKNKMIRENPVPLTTLPRVDGHKEPQIMTVCQQKIFMDYVKHSYLRVLFLLALATGMRSGELRGLEWKNIDLKNKVINIKKSLLYINNDYILDEPKTKSSIREIPIIDSACTILKEHKIEQAKLRVLMGSKWKPKEGLDDLVFTSKTGYPINRDVLKQQMNYVLASIRKDGIKYDHYTPHDLRHTFASRSIENGVQPKVLQTILGHSKLSTTMDLYVHIMPDTKAKEMQCNAGIIG